MKKQWLLGLRNVFDLNMLSVACGVPVSTMCWHTDQRLSPPTYTERGLYNYRCVEQDSEIIQLVLLLYFFSMYILLDTYSTLNSNNVELAFIRHRIHFGFWPVKQYYEKLVIMGSEASDTHTHTHLYKHLHKCIPHPHIYCITCYVPVDVAPPIQILSSRFLGKSTDHREPLMSAGDGTTSKRMLLAQHDAWHSRKRASF